MKPAGFSSIRGLYTNTDPIFVEDFFLALSREEDFLPPERELNVSENNDLEIALQQALAAKSTRSHGKYESTRLSEYYRIRGEIAEKVAVSNIHSSLQTDPFSKAGTNFPNYDIFSPKEMCQVKVLSMQSGEPRYSNYKKYFSNLVNPKSNQNQKAVSYLLELKNQPEVWNQISNNVPLEVREATTIEEMSGALAKNATLRIPIDQVDKVRKSLQNDETLGHLSQEKILPIDEAYSTAHFQMKAAEAVLTRDLQAEKVFSNEDYHTKSQESLDYQSMVVNEKEGVSRDTMSEVQGDESNVNRRSEDNSYDYGYSM